MPIEDSPLKKMFVLLLVVFSSSVFVTKVNAGYTSVLLSPSSGTIGPSETAIELKVDSGVDEFIGIDIDIAFTGPVEFVRATGNKCGFFTPTVSGGTLNIECFFMDGGVYSGTVATLYFKATDTGTSTYSITRVDPESATKAGGTYTLSMESTITSSEEPSTTSSGTNLPQAGLLDNTTKYIVLGGSLVLYGFIFSRFDFFTDKAKTRRISTRQKNFEKRF